MKKKLEVKKEGKGWTIKGSKEANMTMKETVKDKTGGIFGLLKEVKEKEDTFEAMCKAEEARCDALKEAGAKNVKLVPIKMTSAVRETGKEWASRKRKELNEDLGIKEEDEKKLDARVEKKEGKKGKGTGDVDGTDALKKAGKAEEIARRAKEKEEAKASKDLEKNTKRLERERRQEEAKAVKASAVVRLMPCFCGCGQEVKNCFAIGHDGRVHGWYVRASRVKNPETIPVEASEEAVKGYGIWMKDQTLTMKDVAKAVRG